MTDNNDKTIKDEAVVAEEATNETVKTEEVKEEIVEEVAEEEVEDDSLKHNLTKFRVGDTVKVMYKILEGEKHRIQPYIGIVIAIKNSDVSKTFTVRKIGADNIGVERIFPLYSPNIAELSVVKKGKVRRSKLYYLRDKVGRAAMRIKERK